MEIIDLTPYGHAPSPFERKLIPTKNNEYKAVGVMRIMGNIRKPYAIDFDGGPFLAVGSHIGSKTVEKITTKDDDIYVYFQISTKDYLTP